MIRYPFPRQLYQFPEQACASAIRTLPGVVRPDAGTVRAVIADYGTYVLLPKVPLFHADVSAQVGNRKRPEP